MHVIHFVLDGKDEVITVSSGNSPNVQRQAAQAIWDSFDARPDVTMCSPRPE